MACQSGKAYQTAMGETGFNLLQPQEAPPTFWDKAYAWVVGTARVIIIVVEVIVFGAFVARFILDTQTKNLEEQIALQTVKLDALAEKEKYFREVQQKTVAQEDLWKTASNYAPILKEVDAYIPANSTDIDLQLKDDVMLIRGFTNFTTVSRMEASIKNSSTFTQTEVVEIQNEGGGTEDSGNFGLRAILTKFNGREF